jgi:hypothetical protein
MFMRTVHVFTKREQSLLNYCVQLNTDLNKQAVGNMLFRVKTCRVISSIYATTGAILQHNNTWNMSIYTSHVEIDNLKLLD